LYQSLSSGVLDVVRVCGHTGHTVTQEFLVNAIGQQTEQRVGVVHVRLKVCARNRVVARMLLHIVAAVSH
jgi:hypothetical protein